jgi:hypothetical protein
MFTKMTFLSLSLSERADLARYLGTFLLVVVTMQRHTIRVENGQRRRRAFESGSSRDETTWRLLLLHRCRATLIVEAVVEADMGGAAYR